MKRINECACGCGSAQGKCMEEIESSKPESYMFFGNLQIIRRAIDAMLQMDQAEVDAILQDGHGWAVDHIATSKDDIEEVAGFLMNQAQVQQHDEETLPIMGMKKQFIHTFESFSNKQFVNENYDLVSQFKGDHHGNPMGKNKYLNSLGLDEDGIQTIEIWINTMLRDEYWFNQTYPNGASYVDLISDISKKIKDLPYHLRERNLRTFVTKNKSVNPIKVVNFLKVQSKNFGESFSNNIKK